MQNLPGFRGKARDLARNLPRRKEAVLSALFGVPARRMKGRAMRRATGCSETRRWHQAAAAACVALAWLAQGAMAADSDAIGPAAQRYTAICARAGTFLPIIDVGHTAGVAGATSARGTTEYEFNLRLARKISDDLRAAGFTRTVLLVTAEAPRAGLFKRAARANALHGDLFLSIHHDAVPEKMLQTWQFNGDEQHYNDDYPGHSIFVSTEHRNRADSLAFAHRLGMALKARGLAYTPHYTDAIMGSHRRELLDPQAGVYRYNELVVLMQTRMPTALLEAGSIVNRDEELALATPERQALISSAVLAAADGFCARRRPSSVRSSGRDVRVRNRFRPVRRDRQK
jgi:N-acetylmuramoyl-L-alanine amidase